MATAAPPAPNENAVATTTPSEVARRPADLGSPLTAIRSVSGREHIERYETEVKLPAGFQYLIPGKKKLPNGDWIEDNKVGILAEGYEYLNRVLGVSFYLPAKVPDENGEMVNNPIHRRTDGYIYIRMGALWYNEVGQLVNATEDLEVDPAWMYYSARIDTYDALVVMDENGIVYAPDGRPKLKLKDASAEKKALKEMVRHHTMGMRYAQTVLRVRLLKQALGIRSLPRQQVGDFILRLVGYRDTMDPRERQQAAESQQKALFGRPPKTQPLSDAELEELGGVDGALAADDEVNAEAIRIVSEDDKSGDDDQVVEATARQKAKARAKAEAEEAANSADDIPDDPGQ